MFAVVLGIFGLAPLLRADEPRTGALAAAAILGVVAIFRPSLLDVPASWWSRLGTMIARVTNPVVMTALFVLVFVPASALFRLFGKDPLGLARKPADSWWLTRQPPGPPPASMAKQF